MRISRDRDAWLFAGALAIHVLEEAPGFTSWARRHASPRYTAGHFARVNGLGVLSTLGATLVVTRAGGRPAFGAYYLLVVTPQAVWNPVFHASTTVAFREYCPGLATSLAFPAVWLRITRSALSDGLLGGRRGVAATIAAGGVLHGAAVAHQVFFLDARRVRAALSRSHGH